ncbi:MAG: aldo/keto reductase, partial [Pseudomonadota bacterium]|nr:aldo/keto reductase [Pseudomonadota bacterium]
THDTSGAIDRLVEVMVTQDIDFVQMTYSIGERAVEDKLLPVAAERGIAVSVNRPCQGGNLLNSIRGEDVPEWAVEAGCRIWGQFFLKFTLSHPVVSCAIPATSNPNYMADNLESARGMLPDKAMRQRMIRYWEDV